MDLIESCRATIHLVRSRSRGSSDSPVWLAVADLEALCDMAEGRLPLGSPASLGGPLDTTDIATVGARP